MRVVDLGRAGTPAAQRLVVDGIPVRAVTLMQRPDPTTAARSR
ncbi:hypothetical protein ACQPYE_29340 [Actinosynnema sp. CA-299493]